MEPIRSIVFYFQAKEKAIEIAKLLKGYVDVEDGEKENPHIDIDPFHNVIFVSSIVTTKYDELIKKYELDNSSKRIYIIDNINKIQSNYFATHFLLDIEEKEIAEIINEDSENL